MAARRKRRKWSDEEKCRIVAQAKVPGVSVSQVARRYDVNANMIFKWVRDPKYNSGGESEPERMRFLPVEVKQNGLPVEAAPECSDSLGLIKISLANGHHLKISGKFDCDAVVRLIRGLSS